MGRKVEAAGRLPTSPRPANVHSYLKGNSGVALRFDGVEASWLATLCWNNHLASERPSGEGACSHTQADRRLCKRLHFIRKVLAARAVGSMCRYLDSTNSKAP
jgi:hypothetical protein